MGAGRSATKGQAGGMALPGYLGTQELSLHLGVRHKSSLEGDQGVPKVHSASSTRQGRASLHPIEGGISIMGAGVWEAYGRELLDSPALRTLTQFWTGAAPASAAAPSEHWTAPAGSTWGWAPPGLPSGQYGGKRVRNQTPGHLANP